MKPLAGLRSMQPRHDIIAGVTVAAIAIPESLGYAKIAGMPIQTGLYCALLPAILFALLGSSRQLVVGADSATAALVAAGAGAVAAAGSTAYASAVGVLGIMTAGFLVLVVLLRLDFLADLISRPVLAGFLSGVGVSLIIGNLPSMLGIEASGTTWDKLVATVTNLGSLNTTSAALALGTVAVMLLLERRLPKLPAALVALVLLSVVGVLIGAADRGAAMVGSIPAGLPSITVPDFQAGELARMAATAASIAVVVLAQSAAVARSFALKNGYDVSVSQDMSGLAAANLGSAFTGGFAINGSPPRTAAGDGAHSSSQLVNIVMAVVVGLVLLFLTGLFEYIPSAVLDAVVFTIGILLIKWATLREVGRSSRAEFLVAMLTLVVVAFVGVEQGILLAIVVSLIDRLRRQYHPHADVLVSDGSVAARLAPRIALRGALPPGALDDVLVYRFGAPLFFANATFFAEQVRALRAGAKHPVRLMVLDCAAMDDIDYTGAQTMAELGRELRADGGELVVTEASDAALTMLQDSGAAADLSLVPRIEDAVRVRPSAPDAAPAG
ncbi:MAG: SulP family inorganic anion transporter [Candidatus Nanopelagicales bacterium]|nr:SulP family inorganic anion transporter [Candidatus Nanopelagicales bacterium]